MIFSLELNNSASIFSGVTILQLYLKHLNPDQYKENRNLINEKEKLRNQCPKRIAYKNAHDKKRNQLPSRIAIKNAHD